MKDLFVSSFGVNLKTCIAESEKPEWKKSAALPVLVKLGICLLLKKGGGAVPSRIIVGICWKIYGNRSPDTYFGFNLFAFFDFLAYICNPDSVADTYLLVEP
ncbi:MAG: hypothetical protein L3J31_08300 [Bacteroidales bacterium]|nr:hypothetical protein [Bacteroidales bacterium]